MSSSAVISAILPFPMRKMLVAVQLTRFPVGAMPISGPRCVASHLQRPTTLSSPRSARSIEIRQSGKAVRQCCRRSLKASLPLMEAARKAEDKVVGEEFVCRSEVSGVQEFIDEAAYKRLVLPGHRPIRSTAVDIRANRSLALVQRTSVFLWHASLRSEEFGEPSRLCFGDSVS